MPRMPPLFVLLFLASMNAFGQWQMQDSHSTADLRGIHAVDASVAWASGANGTILRTMDGGAHWQRCSVPPDGEKLDFRGIWAWDTKTAMVMSSGPGDQSRLYRTTDAGGHWTEVARNADKDGFWDALVFETTGNPEIGLLIGDPVRGRFYTANITANAGASKDAMGCAAQPGESAYAASNSSLFVFESRRYILGTGGKGGPRVLFSPAKSGEACVAVSAPLAGGNDSSGVFSLAFRDVNHGVAAGGDYLKPKDATGTAAWTNDGGRHWTAASKMPHGYRSTVAWDPAAKTWIAAGTNGSDVSRDDGKTWQPLDDGSWNALSLPFVVGPKGRIGRATRLATP